MKPVVCLLLGLLACTQADDVYTGKLKNATVYAGVSNFFADACGEHFLAIEELTINVEELTWFYGGHDVDMFDEDGNDVIKRVGDKFYSRNYIPMQVSMKVTIVPIGEDRYGEVRDEIMIVRMLAKKSSLDGSGFTFTMETIIQQIGSCAITNGEITVITIKLNKDKSVEKHYVEKKKREDSDLNKLDTNADKVVDRSTVEPVVPRIHSHHKHHKNRSFWRSIEHYFHRTSVLERVALGFGFFVLLLSFVVLVCSCCRKKRTQAVTAARLEFEVSEKKKVPVEDGITIYMEQDQ